GIPLDTPLEEALGLMVGDSIGVSPDGPVIHRADGTVERIRIPVTMQPEVNPFADDYEELRRAVGPDVLAAVEAEVAKRMAGPVAAPSRTVTSAT
ncbi:MAG TPA: hypothetical protein VM597_37170, partial [Gemmataceae bacterium]|nr:hypothetical protein [Gemmataceae bacterium]